MIPDVLPPYQQCAVDLSDFTGMSCEVVRTCTIRLGLRLRSRKIRTIEYVCLDIFIHEIKRLRLRSYSRRESRHMPAPAKILETPQIIALINQIADTQNQRQSWLANEVVAAIEKSGEDGRNDLEHLNFVGSMQQL